MVSVAGFEPATSCSQSRHSTRLNYTEKTIKRGTSGETRTRHQRIKSPLRYQLRHTRIFGSPTWARTRDTRINSPLLYRLSYQGIMVAGNGIEPLCIAYETIGQPLAQPAINLLKNIWRKRGELNPQGAINTQLFSRQVPSPIGLLFHTS